MGLKRLQGNRQLYRKLIFDFAAKCRGAADKIRQVLAAGDLDQGHQLVHSLKGAAGNLAAEGVHQAALALEAMVKGAATVPEAERLDQALARLEESLAEIDVAAEHLGPKPEALAAAPAGDADAMLPPELRREMAGRIREAADIGDVGALHGIAADLEQKTDAAHPLSRRLAALADDFDLDGALQLAEELEAQE